MELTMEICLITRTLGTCIIVTMFISYQTSLFYLDGCTYHFACVWQGHMRHNYLRMGRSQTTANPIFSCKLLVMRICVILDVFSPCQGGGGTGFFDIMSEFFFWQFSSPLPPLSIYGTFWSRADFFCGNVCARMLSTCVASALNWDTRVTLWDWAPWVSHWPAFDMSAVNHRVVRCRSGWQGIDELKAAVS